MSEHASPYFTKIEHIGIAVRSLEEAIPRYERLMGGKVYKREVVESEGVETAFLQCGPNKIELLESRSLDGPISLFLEKRGEGMHHVAYAVADIRGEMQRLRREGFQLLNEEPKLGADGKWVCFIHPRGVSGVLSELCQDRD
ncbi:MAG: methylmalonyl-CoA epimerase [Bacteroidia bacterium]|jgi:methylmalonyl-CoA/ethylmalonyl-CoA epimerase